MDLFKKADYEPVIKEFLDDYRLRLTMAESENVAEENDEWFHEIYLQALAREGGTVIKNPNGEKPGLHFYSHKSSQLLKIAAILMISIFFSLFYYTTYPEKPQEEIGYELKMSGLGEKVQFTLSDGTQVHLNSESKLEYPVPFDETIREVRLEGEAYFVVERDENRPFLVHTEEITTRVLGTSFNMRTYPEDEQVIVAVSSGKVALSGNVMSDNSEEIILEANEWANYNLNTRSLNAGSGDVSSYSAWHEGVLLYYDKTLDEVAIQLERWYGVTISFENEDMKDCVIRGEHRNETLVNVLNAITYAFDMEYHIEGKQVQLKGDGCSQG